MRSVFLQKDKTIFKLSEMPAEEYAASMGLPGAPQIKLLDQKLKVKERDSRIAEVELPPADVVASSDEELDEESAPDNLSESVLHDQADEGTHIPQTSEKVCKKAGHC